MATKKVMVAILFTELLSWMERGIKKCMYKKETMLLKSLGAENLRILALKSIQSQVYQKGRPVTYTLNGLRLYFKLQLFCLSTYRQMQMFLHHFSDLVF